MEEAAPERDNRALMAHIFMLLFVFSPAIGFAMIRLAWGFVAFGITSGIYAYLLGQNDAPVETSEG